MGRQWKLCSGFVCNRQMRDIFDKIASTLLLRVSLLSFACKIRMHDGEVLSSLGLATPTLYTATLRLNSLMTLFSSFII